MSKEKIDPDKAKKILNSGWDVHNWDDATTNSNTSRTLDAPSEDTTYTVNVTEAIG